MINVATTTAKRLDHARTAQVGDAVGWRRGEAGWLHVLVHFLCAALDLRCICAALRWTARSERWQPLVTDRGKQASGLSSLTIITLTILSAAMLAKPLCPKSRSAPAETRAGAGADAGSIVDCTVAVNNSNALNRVSYCRPLPGIQASRATNDHQPWGRSPATSESRTGGRVRGRGPRLRRFLG